ncbi:septum formation initiator [Lactiplantibacillus fabifermentans T30PCM01]|uniref:Septum formation initiator n=1 Tax=Lactiplantibacillus fabifermentans T30PCM01 TaxID=1400520 RepID=W6T3W0_9LACO|nr:SDR family oxidoreductase [Lactiplantibacillus fabifermentans]ETY72572.1 septum formation initiator [Lactiplantibacillus fabifermentans T30PCM01]
MSVKDKVVVVTGASSGIGAATVQELTAQGAKVVFGARREAKLAAVAETLPADSYAYQVVDVTDADQMAALVQLAVDQFGKVDALYNNAGIMPMEPLSNGNHDAWQQMLAVNVMGVLNGINAVLPIMHQQGYGHILTTDSLAGYKVYPNLAVYSGTKYAVRAIMEGLRQEELKNNIRTTVVAPGMVSTELYQSIPDKQTAQDLVATWNKPDHSLRPSDVAEAVAYVIGTPQRVSINEFNIRPTIEL